MVSRNLVPLLALLTTAFIPHVVKGANNPCHGGAVKSRGADCEMVTIPENFCGSCPIGAYETSGEMQGHYVDCIFTYNLTNSCVAKLGEYVEMNPCDTTRKEAYEKFIDRGEKFSRQVLDFFVYAVCENGCDCIPQDGTARRHTPSLHLDRGNCQAHTYYDVCNVLPEIRLIRKEGTVDNSASLPKACPMIDDWRFSPAARMWSSNPHSTIVDGLIEFMSRLSEANQVVELDVYQQCYDLERNQSHIDPPLSESPSLAPSLSSPRNAPTIVEPFTPTASMHINVGSTENVVIDGIAWESDRFVMGGRYAYHEVEVKDTNSDFVFKSERFGNSTYSVPVVAGFYRAILHFAEVFETNQFVGARVFDINVEDQVFFRDVDIFAEAGGYTPFKLTADVEVTDRFLTIKFLEGRAKKPKVSAIEIVLVALADVQTTSFDDDETSKPSPSPTELIDPSISITEFQLVDADTNLDLYTITDGSNIVLPPGSNFNIRAVGKGKPVLSVYFESNLGNRLENEKPWAYGGDFGGDFSAFDFPKGDVTLKATPFTKREAGGNRGVSSTVTFTIV